MKPIRASIGFSKGAKLIPSGAIRWLDGGDFNHVYWRFDFETGSLIYESHFKGGVQITPYEHLLSAKTKGKVLKVEEFDLGLSPRDCTLLWNECIPEHGDGYNTMQIVRYYFWIRFNKRKDSAKVDKKAKDHFTCNQLVVKTGREIVPEMFGLDYTFTIKPLYDLAERCYPPLTP